jgi:hypothetical protein
LPPLLLNYKESNGLEFNRDKRSGVLRCKGCNNAVFTIYRGEVYYSKIDKSTFEEIAECCECLSSTVVSHLRENYDEDSDSFVNLKFRSYQITELDKILNSQKELLLGIVNDTENIENEGQRLNVAKDIINLQKIMDLVKQTATITDEEEETDLERERLTDTLPIHSWE